MKAIRALILFFLVMGTSAFAGQAGVNLAKVDNGELTTTIPAAVVPSVTQKYVYYMVSGNTANEIREQMSEKGIKWDDGKTYDALTTWNVRWDYDYSCTPAGCSPEAFKAAVDITFRFPKWIQSAGAPQPLVALWNTYMKNLITHENGHRDMAVRETADLMQAVSQLPPASTKAELDQEIENLANQRMAKMNADERQYDATTVHGTTQGAVFP